MLIGIAKDIGYSVATNIWLNADRGKGYMGDDDDVDMEIWRSWTEDAADIICRYVRERAMEIKNGTAALSK
jgi:phosphorylcholine metabolism protein LicD